MNPPLPKPTPPKQNNKKQNVVFDQSKKDVNKQDTDAEKGNSRIPLSQKNDISKPQPGAPKPTLPPSSLNALSSSSSNKIPVPTGAGVKQNAPATLGIQKTVLGQPIPQAIRGEAAPAGIGKSAPGVMAPKPTLQVASPRPVGSPPTSPVPTLPNVEGIKKENPVMGEKGKKAASNSKKDPKIAKAKNPILKFLPFIIGGIIILIIIAMVLSRFLGGSSTSVSQNQANPTQNEAQNGTSQPATRTEVPSERITLEYWGLWEPSGVMQEVISDFENENPGIQISYVQQSSADYRERLQTAIQSGSGPDLFRFHASWTPMIKSLLSPIPSSVATSADFKNDYYPVVTEQLVSSGQYVGVPLMYDGLVLYYNEDILSTASETPPSTWPELRSLAVKLTVPSASGIQRGGLAIGNATNVDHFSDVLASLILQNGGNLADASSVETRDALLFYTNFQLADKVWDETLPNSTVAFARGDVAMMFAPSWRAHEIQSLNPDLKFSTSPMPQLDKDVKITWGSYWAEGISTASENKDQAALFLKYLSSDDVLRKFYSNASKVRAFGEIYPKVDMADELAEDKVINSILEDAVYAQSGYMNSYTHDNGINDQTISYYKVAVDALIDSGKIEKIQEALDAGVSQVLKQYGVSTE